MGSCLNGMRSIILCITDSFVTASQPVEQMTGLVGQPITVVVDIESLPAPVVVWSFNNERLSNTSKHYQLL